MLSEWQNCLSRFCTAIVADAPYWYGEQTNIALLTGAALRLEKWHALTEFAAKRTGTRNAFGRIDAWLYNEKEEYYIEAKQLWLELPIEDPKQYIEHSLQRALDAAETIILDETIVHAHRIGLLFVCPRYKAVDEAQAAAQFEQLSQVMQSSEYDAVASFFSNTNRAYKSQRTKKFYPGIVLIAKVIH